LDILSWTVWHGFREGLALFKTCDGPCYYDIIHRARGSPNMKAGKFFDPVPSPWQRPAMLRERPAVSPGPRVARRLRQIVLVELPAWQLLVLAAVAGVLSAASLFGLSFVSGQDAFWQFPEGTIGGAQNDMAQILVGYLYYVQGPWHLPLFHVAALGTPDGANAIMMDVVPILLIAGKLIHSLTGATVNPYGGFLFLCFALPGVMMTLVLIVAGIRNALAAIIGAIFANAMPALLFRWGHITLEAHFLLIGAFALYLLSLQRPASRGVTGAWLGWLTLTYLTNIYLFAMVGIVWLCGLLQLRLNGLTTTRATVRNGALTIAVLTSVIVFCGQFGDGSGLPFGQYGSYSMNLLSPFMPQLSGLVPGLGGVIDATGSQYEGFNYLGMGLLLASIIVLPIEAVWLARNLRRHIVLLVAFVLLTAFAISHRVFAGNSLLFELPMPIYLEAPLGIFRSSGRFFWPIAYAQVAMVVILAFRRPRPVIVFCVAVAAILQLFDVQPLRQQIIASIAAGPSDVDIDRDQVARLVGEARHVEVIPSYQCSETEKLWRTNLELMLATARANVPTNTVYLSRQSYGLTVRDILRAPSRAREMKHQRRAEYCEREIEQARGDGRPGEVFVLLADQPRQQEMVPGITCSPLSWARYCETSGE
jgi:Family of unknown function (DUF6311)